MITKKIFAIVMASMVSATVWADDDNKYNMDNGVIPIADDRGFTLQSNDGSFVFKPYLYLQSTLNYRYYDDEGLDKAYNQDNVANSGFAMNYAIIGFTGKAFGKIDYNVSVNAAASGVISCSRPGSTMLLCLNCVSVWVSLRRRSPMPI